MTITKNIRFYDNQFLDTSNTDVVTGEADHPFSNALSPVRSMTYVPDYSTYRTWHIEADFGYNAPVSLVAIVPKLGEVFNVSEAATITLKANNIDDFTSPPFSQTIVASDYGLFCHIDNSEGGYRYWRLDVDDSVNPLNDNPGYYPVELAYIYFGDHVNITERTINRGFSKQEVDPSRDQVSMSGTRYFEERQKYLELNSMGLGYMPADERRLLEQMFYDFGTHDPFFVSLDPSLEFSDYDWELTRFMRFKSAPTLRNFHSDVYSMAFSLQEVV